MREYVDFSTQELQDEIARLCNLKTEFEELIKETDQELEHLDYAEDSKKIREEMMLFNKVKSYFQKHIAGIQSDIDLIEFIIKDRT